MKLLMIAWGYLPYSFSEGLCNAKLNYALMEAGIKVKTISRVDTGNTYDSTWIAPWDKLKEDTILIDYPLGSVITRGLDVLYSSFIMDGYRESGIRWARRAYQMALNMLRHEHYDAVLTRSPNDIAHLIGYKLKKKTGCRWIANWNDPADPIWPSEYKHDYTNSEQEKKMILTWKLLSSADVNTFPSDSLRLHFIKSFPKLKSLNTEVVPHIGLVKSIWPKAKIRKYSEKIRFVHSGNLSPERNPENTFIAIRRLLDDGYNNFEFHIMGHLNKFTYSLIDKYDLGSVVKGIGSYSYLESISKLQEYDVPVLLEAKLENGIFFASKITDYSQSGLPILAISPAKGFAKEIISHYKAGVVVNNQDIDDIYNGIKKMIIDIELDHRCDSSAMASLFAPEEVVHKYILMISNN